MQKILAKCNLILIKKVTAGNPRSIIAVNTHLLDFYPDKNITLVEKTCRKKLQKNLDKNLQKSLQTKYLQ